jgi:hypothetical protein
MRTAEGGCATFWEGLRRLIMGGRVVRPPGIPKLGRVRLGQSEVGLVGWIGRGWLCLRSPACAGVAPAERMFGS